MTKLITYVCPNCEGTNCGYEATACWDDVKQTFVLGTTFDNRWCNDCGDISELEEVELQNEALAYALQGRHQLQVRDAAPELLAKLEDFLTAYMPPDEAPLSWEALNAAAESARQLLAQLRDAKP